uniref:Uncharacterized protein n=1 Tax=Hyaloperonospora arabidopsidis (strain Emoy2) TaxID=559515 RepID=M4BDJ7_HYAAE
MGLYCRFLLWTWKLDVRYRTLEIHLYGKDRDTNQITVFLGRKSKVYYGSPRGSNLVLQNQYTLCGVHSFDQHSSSPPFQRSFFASDPCSCAPAPMLNNWAERKWFLLWNMFDVHLK